MLAHKGHDNDKYKIDIRLCKKKIVALLGCPSFMSQYGIYLSEINFEIILPTCPSLGCALTQTARREIIQSGERQGVACIKGKRPTKVNGFHSEENASY